MLHGCMTICFIVSLWILILYWSCFFLACKMNSFRYRDFIVRLRKNLTAFHIVLLAMEVAVITVQAEMEVAVTKQSLLESMSIILYLKIMAHLIRHIDLILGKLPAKKQAIIHYALYCLSPDSLPVISCYIPNIFYCINFTKVPLNCISICLGNIIAVLK